MFQFGKDAISGGGGCVCVCVKTIFARHDASVCIGTLLNDKVAPATEVS